MKPFSLRSRLMFVVSALVIFGGLFFITKSPNKKGVPPEQPPTESATIAVSPGVTEPMLASVVQASPPAIKPAPELVLIWDAELKEVNFKPGEYSATTFFSFTNLTSEEIIITLVQPSCGCTTAKLPPLPWKIAPNTSGQIDLSINATGLTGTIIRTVTVVSTVGKTDLHLKLVIPVTPFVPANIAVADANNDLPGSVSNGTGAGNATVNLPDLNAGNPENSEEPPSTDAPEAASAINTTTNSTTGTTGYGTVSGYGVVSGYGIERGYGADSTDIKITTDANPAPTETPPASP